MPLQFFNQATLDARYVLRQAPNSITSLQTFVGGVVINLPSAGIGLIISKGGADLQTGSVFIDRPATNVPHSIVFGTGVAFSVGIGRGASTDDLSVDKFDGATFSSMAKFTTADTANQSSLFLRFNDGSSNRFERLQLGAADSGGTGKRAFVVQN